MGLNELLIKTDRSAEMEADKRHPNTPQDAGMAHSDTLSASITNDWNCRCGWNRNHCISF